MRKRIPVPRIVQPAESKARAVMLGGVSLLVLVALAFAFQFGRTQAGYHALEAKRKSADFQQQLVAMTEKNAELKREVELLRGSREINRGAIKALKAEITSLQEGRLRQEEELAVLRNVLANGGVKGGLRIHDFELQGLDSARGYRFKFTVSQTHKDFGVTSGQIEISVSGKQNGKDKRFPFAAMSEDKSGSLKMKFRYFQNVEGNILLPEEFEPATFSVDLKPTSEGLVPVSQTFDWPHEGA